VAALADEMDLTSVAVRNISARPSTITPWTQLVLDE